MAANAVQLDDKSTDVPIGSGVTIADLRRDPDQLLSQPQLCTLLGKSEAWAERGRWAGYGPEYIKIGRSVRYRGAAVLSYLEANTRQSTSDSRRSA